MGKLSTTFYLSDDVDHKILMLSKKYEVAKSEILELILSIVFHIEPKKYNTCLYKTLINEIQPGAFIAVD